jgi:hypothetical protein
MAKKIDLTEKQAKNSPQGGVLVGKRNGQTIIYDDGKVGGWFVGKTHKEGGIKGVDKTSGQPIEVQTGEVIITAPALADQSKREFQGKMMTNRQILSKINSDAGGVAFAEDGAEVSSKMLCNGGSYSFGGKMMSDKEIAEEINKCGCEHDEDDNKFELGGHLSKGMSLEDIAKMHNVTLEELDKQVELGMKDESIHAGTYLDHFNIVKDHLVESPTFYTDESEKFHEGGYTSYKDKYNKKYGYPLDKSHDLEDIHKDTGVSIKGLQEIYNKGIGAFKTNHESVRENVTSKEQWAMARVYSAVMGGKAAKIDSHELKMSHGGKVHKESLVRDAKSGNTPARDLNNYNDMLDVEADGRVGGDTGIYAKGGLTPYDANLEGDSINVNEHFDFGGDLKLPKVEKITISNTSVVLNSLNNKVYTNYRDFLRDIREIFINDKIECYIYFKINDRKDTAKILFKDARNTVNYFNPITGTPKDLYKQIEARYKYYSQKFDWSDFFSGNRTVVVNPNTSVNVTSSFAKAFDFTNTKLKVLMDKDLSIRVQQKAFDEGWEWENNHGKNLDYSSFNYLYFTKKSISYGNSTSTFDNSPKREITEAEIFGNAQQTTTKSTFNNILTDLSDTKIWIGDNPKLSKAVQERAFELGWKYPSAKEATKSIDNAEALYFYKDKTINYGDTRTTFDNRPNLKEIFIEDIFGTSTPNLTKTSSKPVVSNQPFNLDNTKIWVENNPDLSRRIQDLAFAQGYKNENGSKDYVNADGLTFTYLSKNIGKQIYGFYSILVFEKEPEKEIFETDVFGITKGEKDLFDAIDFVIENNGFNIDINGWADEKHLDVNRTKDFDVVNTETGDVYTLRSFKKNLGYADDAQNKQQAKEMLVKYKKYKENQNNINVNQPVIKTQPTVPGSTVDSLDNTKIWIGGKKDLFIKVQELAFELGLTDTNGSQIINTDAYAVTDWITFQYNSILRKTSRGTFNASPATEITEVDMMLLVEDMKKNKALFINVNQPVIKTQPTTSDLIPDSIPNFSGLISDLPEPIKQLALLRKKESNFTKDSDEIAEAFSWSRTKEGDDFWADISIGDFKLYKDMYGSSLQTFTNFNVLITDLSNTQIKINNDLDLAKRVVEKAEELGWVDSKAIKRKINDKDDIDYIWFSTKEIKYIGWDNQGNKEITEADLFGTTSQSTASIQIPEKKSNQPKNEFTADLDKLVFKDSTNIYGDDNLIKDRKDLENFKKLLPSFQESKFAVEKATILKEINRLNKKITYETFIKPNEKASNKFETFTPQGLLKYYWSQSTQSPVAPLEPACELPTPNGAKSKLPMNAYLNVRTPQFKKWFGDWEKAYETNNYLDCSKMIDEETKEPKIFYHGVRKYVPNFGQFSNMGQGVVRPYGSFEPPTAFPASYFANNEDYAKFYAGDAPNMPKPSADYEPFIYKVFLNIKNPIDLLPLDLEVSYKDVIDYMTIAYGIKIQPSNNVLSLIKNDMKAKHPIWVYIRNDVSLLETIKDFGYDALIQYGDIPVFDTNGQVVTDRSKFIKDIEYLTFNPTQIKSATVRRSFYFNFFNDIRFNKGGYVRI